MLSLVGSAEKLCNGMTRRKFLQMGTLGAGGFALPELLARRASAGETRSHRSVIMICLNGGASHHDTYDMKPLAPLEIRGEYLPIPTNVPGIELCERMPRQATIADKFSIVRSLKMIQPNHQLHECYTGYPTDAARPSFGSVVSATRRAGTGSLPPYVSLSLTDHPRTVEMAEQPTYLGLAHAPFEPGLETLANIQLNAEIPADRFRSRRELLRTFDRFQQKADLAGSIEALDSFHQQALDILTSPAVRDAFDISREPPAMHELYGGDTVSPFNYQFGHTWRGGSFLMARRLVEAGVRVVTLSPGAWDHHGNLNGVIGTIFERLDERLPLLDRSLYALISDLHARGLSREVLVVVWGEFGRTPRVNKYGGRDHWTPVNFVLFAGGDLKMGQVIGSTDRIGGEVTSKIYGAENVMETIYRHLGIDSSTTFPNFAGRPVAALDNREPIAELI